MRRPVAVLALLPFASAQAQAIVPEAPPRPATTWEAVAQPLSALLNGGYQIVAMTGPGFTLEKGGKYVLCEVRPASGFRGSTETTSECHRLN